MALDIKNIEETPHLLNILLEIEDVLDSLDIYVFRNWIEGEIVEGPIVKRYWSEIILKFASDKMPDPRAGLRLLKHGIQVKFRKEKEGNEHKQTDIWLVELSVPRILLGGMRDMSTDFYDDEIDIQDINSAKDMGVDDESDINDTGAK